MLHNAKKGRALQLFLDDDETVVNCLDLQYRETKDLEIGFR